MAEPATASAKTYSARLWRLPARPYRLLIGLVLAGAGVAVGWEIYHVLIGANWHVVIPGCIYRSAQKTPMQLEQTLERHGIRTVVNLRGCCNPWPWYMEECLVTQRRQVSQEDICLSAGRLPSAHEIHRLLEVLDQAEYPLLLHCRRGADRTGLVAAIVLLLQPEGGLAQARWQMGLRYGHLAMGRPAHLDLFLDLYEAWLAKVGQPHSPTLFRRWLRDEYPNSWCAYAVESIAPVQPLRKGEPLAVRVRFRNTGVRPWPFRPHLKAGIHAGFVLWDANDVQVADGRAGLFAQDVAPGETIEVTVVIPPLARGGKYRLLVDLIDEQHGWFFQAGAAPVEEELDVRD